MYKDKIELLKGMVKFGVIKAKRALTLDETYDFWVLLNNLKKQSDTEAMRTLCQKEINILEQKIVD